MKTKEWERLELSLRKLEIPTKRTFHEKVNKIKNKNSMDLTEAEDIKKRWKEHTEELYKKDLDGPDNHDGVNTHLEPDTLECKVKWALGLNILWHCPSLGLELEKVNKSFHVI